MVLAQRSSAQNILSDMKWYINGGGGGVIGFAIVINSETYLQNALYFQGSENFKPNSFFWLMSVNIVYLPLPQSPCSSFSWYSFSSVFLHHHFQMMHLFPSLQLPLSPFELQGSPLDTEIQNLLK